jgi:hypothetical protein
MPNSCEILDTIFDIEATRQQRPDWHKLSIAWLREFREWSRTGPRLLSETRPRPGFVYHRLTSAQLQRFLVDAEINLGDDRYDGFTMLVGTNANDETPFICIKNHNEDGLHLVIGGGV